MPAGRGWRYAFPAVPWQERLVEYERAVADGIPLEYMVDIVRSIIASGRADELCSNTSHFDLLVAMTPADDPPFEVIAVRTLAALKPPADGCVRIEHQALTGHDDSIERPTADAVRLFWRFVIEKFGIEPAPRTMGPDVLTRELLVPLLDVTSGAAVDGCLRAMRSGALIHSGDAQATCGVDGLLVTFRRRLKHVQRIGLETVGLVEGVRSLEQASGQRVHLGVIDGEHHWFTVLVSEDCTTLVACWAVPHRTE